ncbi:mitochondrial carrier [Obba rivulosa]|uniref:Mitochondrial carrier n=1 Tax=Obba rivulosa TaxID=1052685 RepID=A0A8E2AUJ9_9APHY|nr:mitochondrial carrier [Obba rivulosa]
MTTPPSSLRDMYATPPDAWSFIPPVPGPSSNDSALSSSISPSSSSSTYQWSTRTASSSPLFDLSSSIVQDDDGLDVQVVIKGLLVSALMEYATTVVTQPWDVGKTLLQVQWVPRDAGEVPPEPGMAPEEPEEEELSDSSNENETYFADPSTPKRAVPRPADERGYVMRQSVLDEATQPEYIIPVGSASGTWGMMKALINFRTEGWLSLWKGLLTATVKDALETSLQPTMHSLLQSLFSAVMPSSPLSPVGPSSLLFPVASHVFTGVLLSPLDLVCTRLIIQSSHPRYRTYSGPIDALRQILTHEGGVRGLYLHPHLLIPTVLDCSLRAAVSLTLPRLVAARFGASPETSPFLWSLAELLGVSAGLLITIPFETVRKRLQAQVRGSARPLRPCVELRPAPYNGVVDAIWHILTEERSDLPIKRPSRRKGKEREDVEDEQESETWLRHTGIGQLYRGLGIRLGASVFTFVLALLVGGDEPDAGWAEL